MELTTTNEFQLLRENLKLRSRAADQDEMFASPPADATGWDPSSGWIRVRSIPIISTSSDGSDFSGTRAAFEAWRSRKTTGKRSSRQDDSPDYWENERRKLAR